MFPTQQHLLFSLNRCLIKSILVPAVTPILFGTTERLFGKRAWTSRGAVQTFRLAILDNAVLQVPFGDPTLESKRTSNAISLAPTPEEEDATEWSELSLNVLQPAFVDAQADEVSVSFFD